MSGFCPPVACARVVGDHKALWRHLFMAALEGTDPSSDSIRAALYAVSVSAGAPLVAVVDELVELGLRAPMDAFPESWCTSLRGRVLDLGQRALLPYRLASLAARWGWMPAPVARLDLPLVLDGDLDPYGADLLQIFMGDLGPAPRFGHTPAQVRLAMLRTAVGVGRPLAILVEDLASRAVVLPMEAVPASCRETLKRLPEPNPLLAEMLTSWGLATQKLGEVVPLRRAFGV